MTQKANSNQVSVKQPQQEESKFQEAFRLKMFIRSAAMQNDAQSLRHVICRVAHLMSLQAPLDLIYGEMVLALSSECCTVRRMVFAYLRQYAAGAFESGMGILTIEALRRHDTHPWMRIAQLQTLLALQGYTLVHDPLRLVLNAQRTDPSPLVRRGTAFALVEISREDSCAVIEAEPVLESMVQTDQDPLVRRDALFAWRRLRPDKDLTKQHGQLLLEEFGLKNSSTGSTGGRDEAITDYRMQTNSSHINRSLSAWWLLPELISPKHSLPTNEHFKTRLKAILQSQLYSHRPTVVITAARALLRLCDSDPEAYAKNQETIVKRLGLLHATLPGSPEHSLIILRELLPHVLAQPRVLSQQFDDFAWQLSDTVVIRSLKLSILTAIATRHTALAIIGWLSHYIQERSSVVHVLQALAGIASRFTSSTLKVFDIFAEQLLFIKKGQKEVNPTVLIALADVVEHSSLFTKSTSTTAVTDRDKESTSPHVEKRKAHDILSHRLFGSLIETFIPQDDDESPSCLTTLEAHPEGHRAFLWLVGRIELPTTHHEDLVCMALQHFLDKHHHHQSIVSNTERDDPLSLLEALSDEPISLTSTKGEGSNRKTASTNSSMIVVDSVCINILRASIRLLAQSSLSTIEAVRQIIHKCLRICLDFNETRDLAVSYGLLLAKDPQLAIHLAMGPT